MKKEHGIVPDEVVQNIRKMFIEKSQTTLNSKKPRNLNLDSLWLTPYKDVKKGGKLGCNKSDQKIGNKENRKSVKAMLGLFEEKE